jgi:hypothetical protein
MMRPPVRNRREASRNVLNTPLGVDCDLAVEQRVVALGDRRHLHDAGIVDHHIDAAKRCLRTVEQTGDGGGIGDIGLLGGRAALVALDLRHQRFGGGGVAGIVDDDGEAVAGQTLRDRSPDTTGGSGNDRDFGTCAGHGLSPDLPRR